MLQGGLKLCQNANWNWDNDVGIYCIKTELCNDDEVWYKFYSLSLRKKILETSIYVKLIINRY